MCNPKIAQGKKQAVTTKPKIKKLFTKLKSSPSWITHMIINEIFEQATETISHNCSDSVWAQPQLKGPVQFHPSLALHFPCHIRASIWHDHFGTRYWIPPTAQQSDHKCWYKSGGGIHPFYGSQFIGQLTLTVKLQPMPADKRDHKTSNHTVQPSALMPHYKKMKSQCSCCSEGLKMASSELAYPSARLELQIKTKYKFTVSKGERNTWGKGYPRQSEKTGYEQLPERRPAKMLEILKMILKHYSSHCIYSQNL